MAPRPKRNRLESSEAVDRISNLSDEIVCHILSFLPTKSTVKTNILAKRWRYIWTKVPVLDFTDMPPLKHAAPLKWQQKVNFRSFVDKVLFHNDASYILRLCLKLYEEHDDFYVNSWLGAIMRREIREIVICRARGAAIPFSIGSLSFGGLVVLKLGGKFSIDVPEHLHLPSLEILHFRSIDFASGECLKRLLLGCHILKELVLRDCYGHMYVQSSTLEELHIEQLNCWDSSARVVIETPKLTYLHIIDELKLYAISDLSLVVEANITLYDLVDCYSFEYGSYASEILNKVSGVSTLVIGGYNSELFELLSEFELPTFWNLTHLQLDKVDGSVCQMLKLAPSLKSLSVDEVYSDYEDSSETESRPECLKHLENVEMRCFRGYKAEMEFVAYCLKVAPVLKEIKINLNTNNMDREKERDVVQRLLKLPWSSAACQLTLSFDKFIQGRICKVPPMF